MDQTNEARRKSNVCYALLLLLVLSTLTASLVLQLLALKDEDQMPLALAAQAAVDGFQPAL